GSAFLGAAMTPGPRGPEGAGEGISRAFQGALGANQFMFNRQMQAAMLPYQMLGPKIDMMDKLAQMQQREQLAKHYIAQDKYYQDRADYYDRQATTNENRVGAKKAVGQPYASDQGNMYQDMLDPISGEISQKYVGQGEAERAPTFKNREQHRNLLGGSGD